MNKHRVRTHHWLEGRLEVLDNWFESLEEALGFADSSEAHHIKIYNPDGGIRENRQQVVPQNQSTYA
jgi:methylaspartate ammonia-lyase